MINFIIDAYVIVPIVVTILPGVFVVAVVVVLPIIVRVLVGMVWMGVVQLFVPKHQTVRRFKVLPVFIRIELGLDQQHNVDDTYHGEKAEPHQRRFRRHRRLS